MIQTESSVSMEGHFLLDGDLAQDVTVGTPAIRMKTSESSGPEFDQRIWVKPRNACKWVCFQSWKPCVHGQTLFTWHRPHTSYWLHTQTWYLCSTYQGTGGWWTDRKVNYLWMNVWHTKMIIVVWSNWDWIFGSIATVRSELQAWQFDNLVGACAVQLVTVFLWQVACLEMGGSSCNKSTCLDKCDRNSDNFFYCQQALGFYSGQNTTCPIYSQFNSIHN